MYEFVSFFLISISFQWVFSAICSYWQSLYCEICQNKKERACLPSFQVLDFSLSPHLHVPWQVLCNICNQVKSLNIPNRNGKGCYHPLLFCTGFQAGISNKNSIKLRLQSYHFITCIFFKYCYIYIREICLLTQRSHATC